jgi:hypothetical protein
VGFFADIDTNAEQGVPSSDEKGAEQITSSQLNYSGDVYHPFPRAMWMPRADQS